MGKWTDNEKNCSRDFRILGAVLCLCLCVSVDVSNTKEVWQDMVVYSLSQDSSRGSTDHGTCCCRQVCLHVQVPVVNWGSKFLTCPWSLWNFRLCNFFITPGQSSCRILVPQEDLPAQGPSAGSLGGNSYVLHGYRRLFFVFVCVLTTHNGYLM